MVHAGCLAHARRKFVEAVKVNAKDSESAPIVTLMDQLFAIDREAREKNLSHAEHHALRQERTPQLLDELGTNLLAIKETALPKSSAGQAANYILSLWPKLTLFLKYPELELARNRSWNTRSRQTRRAAARDRNRRNCIARFDHVAVDKVDLSLNRTSVGSHNFGVLQKDGPLGVLFLRRP